METVRKGLSSNWRCRLGLHEWTPWSRPFQKRYHSLWFQRSVCPHCEKIKERNASISVASGDMPLR